MELEVFDKIISPGLSEQILQINFAIFNILLIDNEYYICAVCFTSRRFYEKQFTTRVIKKIKMVQA